MKNIFTSDLHGNKNKYEIFLKIIEKEQPNGVFIGGDILPNPYASTEIVSDFLTINLFNPLENIREKTGEKIRCFIILGNDDPRINEEILIQKDEEKIIDYALIKCRL